MAETKFVKAKCKKMGLYFGLEVAHFGKAWEVVNMVSLAEVEAKVAMTEVVQDNFYTHSNLLACTVCGNRRVGGCSCAKKMRKCSEQMTYQFNCIYCKEFEIDYSRPSAGDVRKYQGKTITTEQNKEIKIITFSNVRWNKFDNIQTHPFDMRFREPLKHVVIEEEDIEFDGYHVSQMDEGVYYIIGGEDDFEIECDVNTSKIKPHPGGYLYISFGEITAEITQTGGAFSLAGKDVAQVRSRFHMRLSLTGNKYLIEIDGKKVGELIKQNNNEIKIVFGFAHDSHYCDLLSHAYLKGIKMQHGTAPNGN